MVSWRGAIVLPASSFAIAERETPAFSANAIWVRPAFARARFNGVGFIWNSSVIIGRECSMPRLQHAYRDTRPMYSTPKPLRNEGAPWRAVSTVN